MKPCFKEMEGWGDGEGDLHKIKIKSLKKSGKIDLIYYLPLGNVFKMLSYLDISDYCISIFQLY